ncbi:MAG: cbb3-type cytochrome c oxidase subunit 3, partial [Rhodospirillaceae bacterium]|nr:cbb3-type cytochrome c oxidase subunit 3 [Rhodospirillaceae bacterium]
MALFVIIVAWVLWPSNREKFRRAAQIPLSEDKQSADAVSDRPDQTSSADRKNRI